MSFGTTDFCNQSRETVFGKEQLSLVHIKKTCKKAKIKLYNSRENISYLQAFLL